MSYIRIRARTNNKILIAKRTIIENISAKKVFVPEIIKNLLKENGSIRRSKIDELKRAIKTVEIIQKMKEKTPACAKTFKKPLQKPAFDITLLEKNIFTLKTDSKIKYAANETDVETNAYLKAIGILLMPDIRNFLCILTKSRHILTFSSSAPVVQFPKIIQIYWNSCLY